MSEKNRLLVCVAGMPGSGKSIVARAARDLGLPVLVMGDVVREEVKRLGLQPTPENMNYVARLLRQKYGKAAVALRVAEKLASMGSTRVVIDGVRSLDEINVFRRHGRVVIVAVHASPRTRFERLRKRGRPGDPRSWEDFVARDMVELGFGLGNVIALADFMIVNEGGVEEAYNTARRLLGELLDAENKS